MRRAPTNDEQAGFTLIELLVVIIIIGILAAIAIPVYLNQRTRGFEAQMRSDLRTSAEEMELYFVRHGDYPTVSQSGRSVTIGPDTFTVSPDVDITGYLNPDSGVKPGTYCLKATSGKIPTAIYYDSDQGGIQPKGTGCA